MATSSSYWKETALARSEVITDAWEITKVYAGRLAEWVLFACMVMNIIEILPGVTMWPALINAILGVQAVSLDIAGFGLATMAQQAEADGQARVARKAKHTAYLLITLMMVTVLSVSIGTLWPSFKVYTDVADKVLILVRVAMTVWYGHVLHDLRDRPQTTLPTPVIVERLEQLAHHIADLQQRQESHLVTILGEVERRIAAIPQPEPIAYGVLAETVLARLPEPEPINYAALAEQIVPLLPQSAVPDVTLVVEQLAALTEQLKRHESEQRATMIVTTERTESDQDSDAEVAPERTESEQESDTVANTSRRDSDARIVKLVDKKASQREGRGEAYKRAQRILKRHPDITPTELAKRASISRSYASQVLAERSA